MAESGQSVGHGFDIAHCLKNRKLRRLPAEADHSRVGLIEFGFDGHGATRILDGRGIADANWPGMHVAAFDGFERRGCEAVDGCVSSKEVFKNTAE